MSKNSIEEDIAITKKLITTKFNNDYSIDNKDKEAIEHILADYKKVLKENRKSKSNIVPILINNKMYFLENELYKDLLEEINKNYMLKAHIKEILEKTEITNYNKLVDMFLEIKKILGSEK